MAARYGAGQYEDAFSSRRLQNWSVPRPGRQCPSLREGSTQIIADDRGHLLPTVPRSQASPWGTFVATWEMPPRIPPARLDLTSRSAAAAARLLGWIRQPTTLTRAHNGLRTEITGKRKTSKDRVFPDAERYPQPPAPHFHFSGDRSDGASSPGRPASAPGAGPPEPQRDRQTATEPSPGSSRASSEGIPPARAALAEPPSPGAGPPARLSRQPSALRADASPEPPAPCQPCSRPAGPEGRSPRSPQPAGTDRRGDTGSAQTSAPAPHAPREASAPHTPPGGQSPRPGASPRGVRGKTKPGRSAVRARRPSCAGL